MKTNNVNNIIRIPTSTKSDFFAQWLLILKPFHNLASREIEIAAYYLRKRFELQLSVTDESLIDLIVMSEATRNEIMEKCNVKYSHFHIILNKLKKTQFIKDGRINPKFIPKKLNDSDKSFQLLFYFDFNG